MAAEKRKVKKWGWKTLLALLGLAAAGAFGFFSIFNTVRVAAAEPSLSENEANEAASVTITDAELEQLLSGELTLDSLTRTGTDEAPAASEAQGTAAGEQPARTESEAAASSEPEDSVSGTEQSAYPARSRAQPRRPRLRRKKSSRRQPVRPKSRLSSSRPTR